MEKIKMYWKEISFVVIVIILLSINSCSNNRQNQLEGEKKVLKEQLQQQKDGLKVFRKEQKILFDSLSAENTKKDKRITELNNSNNNLYTELSKSAEKLKKQKKDIASYTYKQSAEALNERYNTKSVLATSTSVNLQDSIPNLVIEELAEKDAQEYDLNTYRGLIKNKDEEIKLTQEKVLNKDLEIASKQIETEKLDIALKLSEDINKKSEKQIKALKTKNFIMTYLVPPTAIFLGFKAGQQLAK